MKQIHRKVWDRIWKHVYMLTKVLVGKHARDQAWEQVETPVWNQENRQVAHQVDRQLRISSDEIDTQAKQ